jgi:hypothetical protein
MEACSSMRDKFVLITKSGLANDQDDSVSILLPALINLSDIEHV